MTLLCSLLAGGKVIDGNCTCTFSRISGQTMFGGKLEGEGSIRIMKMLPFELQGKEPRQFSLRFEAAIVPGVGKLEEVPIILVPDDLDGVTTASFRIGKL